MDEKTIKNMARRKPFQKDKHGIKRLFFNPSTLETIDKSVLNYLESLNLFSTTNKGWNKVPVIWSTAERSFQAKREEEIRDAQGALIMPIISIHRASVKKPLKSSGAYQGNVPGVADEQNGAIPVERVLYQEKTTAFAKADANRLEKQENARRNNQKIVYRTVSIPMPVNIDITYEITIRTEYQQQMNELIAPFISTPGTINYVLLQEQDHRYEGFIQQDFQQQNNLNNFANEERKFETKITINVVGYLIGEEDNSIKPSFAVRENAVEVKIPRERVSLQEIPEHEFGAYYGLSGVPISAIRAARPFSFFFSNVPAVGPGAAGSGTGDVSGNIITINNFGDTLAETFSIRELLKDEGAAPPAKEENGTVRFTLSEQVKENTESVFVNGLIQAFGANNDYIMDGNVVIFNASDSDPPEGPIVSGDSVYVSYIKG
jgi:quinol monooxygenase YgiN